jgi:hypothetical protein
MFSKFLEALKGQKIIARGGFPSGGRDWGAKRNPWLLVS